MTETLDDKTENIMRRIGGGIQTAIGVGLILGGLYGTPYHLYRTREAHINNDHEAVYGNLMIALMSGVPTALFLTGGAYNIVAGSMRLRNKKVEPGFGP